MKIYTLGGRQCSYLTVTAKKMTDHLEIYKLQHHDASHKW